MRIALPELQVSATLILDSENALSESAYLTFCEANPDLRLEKTARGEIIIAAPGGLEWAYRSLGVAGELRAWARVNGRGKGFGCSAEFLLPDGAAFSPDAAWVSNQRLASVPKAELRKFPHIVPEFVVEVMSPGDRLPAAKRKMIDGDAQRVYVFRHGCEMRVLKGAERIEGEGPVEGFVLELNEIWQSL